MQIKNVVTAALKKVARAEIKKVVMAMLVFGMIISPAVEAIASLDEKTPNKVVVDKNKSSEAKGSVTPTQKGVAGVDE
ncbi:hypothetical protein AGMMS49592_1250 [Endomicrobiia bacterium]|nr:hypothetical protein AGMMS49592_1250 [Endomicrobiia bacterium]